MLLLFVNVESGFIVDHDNFIHELPNVPSERLFQLYYDFTLRVHHTFYGNNKLVTPAKGLSESAFCMNYMTNRIELILNQ